MTQLGCELHLLCLIGRCHFSHGLLLLIVVLEADATVKAALAGHLLADLLENQDGVLVVGGEEHVGQGLLLDPGHIGDTGGGGGGRGSGGAVAVKMRVWTLGLGSTKNNPIKVSCETY